MLSNVVNVSELCRKYNLEVQQQQCTNKGILLNDIKFSVIDNYPRPTDADISKRFVAFCN